MLDAFWGESHWGDWWHRVRVVNGIRSVHSGHDINGHRARTKIPLLDGGTITIVGRAADIGRFVEIRVASNRYDTYCHIIPDVILGNTYRRGQTVGLIAGRADDPGSMWSGPHLHFMTASRSGAWADRRLTADPRPAIRSALAGGGSGGGGLPDDEEEPKVEVDEMVNIQYRSSVVGGKRLWAILHPFFRDGALVTTDPNVALGWESAFAIKDDPNLAVSEPRWAGMLASAKLAADSVAVSMGGGTSPETFDYDRMGQAARDAIVKPA